MRYPNIAPNTLKYSEDVMNTSWKTHLEQQGAVFEADTVTDFGNAQAETNAATERLILADLSHLGMITAQGADATDFLQGQLSNDVRQVDASHSQITAYCNPKGRLLASFRLFMRDDAYCLSLPAALLEPTLKRLRMFVLRSQVTLEDGSDTLVTFGYAGPNADTALASAMQGAVPEEPDAVTQNGELTVIRLPGSQPRFEIHGPAEAAIALWETLRAEAQPVGMGAWALLDILAGIPNIYPGTVDAFIPQMVNLQAIGGVSFKKGCYPGQEIVARTQYLGKLKRRMYRAHVQADHFPQPGEDIYTGGDTQSAGRIVSAQAAPEGGYELLAVLQIASAESELHLGSIDGPTLTLHELPYALEA